MAEHGDPVPALLVQVESVLWNPGRGWPEALEHLARRFRRLRALDTATVAARSELPDLAPQLRELETWAGDDIDLDRELGRYFDEHLPVHVRPDRSLNQTVRAAARQGRLVAFSSLPEAPLRSVLAHVGVLRAFDSTCARVSGYDAESLRHCAGASDNRFSVISAVPATREAVRQAGGDYSSSFGSPSDSTNL